MLLAAIASAGLLAGAPGQVVYSDATGDLFVAGPDGKSSTSLFTADGTTALAALENTPDGTAILAVDSGDEHRIVVVPLAGGAVRAVRGSSGADAGTLSPDGTTVAFSTETGIYSVPFTGGTPKQLVATPVGSTDSLPRYAPNGQTIAFVREAVDDAGNALGALETIPASGGSPTPLATGVLASFAQGGRISFSPDGMTLVFAGDGDHPGIASVPASGGAVTHVTNDLDYWPIFSNAGTLLFARSTSSPNSDSSSLDPVDPVADDLYELWTSRQDGTGARVLAEGDYETLAVTTGTTNPPGPPAPAPGAVEKPPVQKLGAVLAKGGFSVGVSCPHACTITSVLVGRLPARRQVLTVAPKVWGRGSVRRPSGGRSKLFVRLNAAAKKSFPRTKGFTLTLRTTIQSSTGRRTSSQPVRFTT